MRRLKVSGTSFREFQAFSLLIRNQFYGFKDTKEKIDIQYSNFVVWTYPILVNLVHQEKAELEVDSIEQRIKIILNSKKETAVGLMEAICQKLMRFNGLPQRGMFWKDHILWVRPWTLSLPGFLSSLKTWQTSPNCI